MMNLEKLDKEQTTEEIEVIYDVPAPVRASDVVYSYPITQPYKDRTTALALVGASLAGVIITLLIIGVAVSL